MKKINFNELKKMNYEEGKEILLQAGYIQNDNAVDEKENYNINDEYYTLYNENGNELHIVSYVTYTKDNPGDEPNLINKENWHWSEIPQ